MSVIVACMAMSLLQDQRQSLAGMVALARQDIIQQPIALRSRIRYLDLSEVGLDKKEEKYRVLAGHVQHLSRSSDIVRPVIVSGTAGSLLRLNIDDYLIDRKIWEQLADVDPYFHAKLEFTVRTPWPGGKYGGDGKVYAANSFNTVRRVFRTAFAPEVGEAMIDLARLTNSNAPIVRGRWFFNQTAAQKNRVPGYYDFLGVKDRKTFEALGSFDRKIAEVRPELRETVARSGVTLQPTRALVRYAIPDGAYWYSLDFEQAVGVKNPQRILGRDIEKEADGIEAFITLPNGFWATGAFSGQGVRADTVPDSLASNSISRSHDKRIHPNVSCITCHTKGGLQDIDGWVRNLNQPPLELKSPDYDFVRKLRQQYVRSLEPFLERDRKIYETAVKEATGWTSTVYAGKYLAMWEEYEDAEVDINWAANDLGISVHQFRIALDVYMMRGLADPVLGALLLQGPRARTVGIRQWLEAVPLARQVIAQSRLRGKK